MSLSLRAMMPTTSPMAALSALPTCASPYCPRPATLWQRWWARHEGVWLHGDWYCSQDCFHEGLYRLLELAQLAPPKPPRPANRLPLGLVLLSQGDITAGQLREALQRQKEAKKGKIGEWLVGMGAISEQQVRAALAVQQGCPLLNLQQPQWLDARLDWPMSLVRRYRAVPVFHDPARSLLYVGSLDTVDRSFLYSVEQILRCRTEPCIIPTSAYEQHLELRRGRQESESIEIHQRHTTVEMTRTIGNYAAQIHAERCGLVRCEDRLWIRLESPRDAHLDMLFRAPGSS